MEQPERRQITRTITARPVTFVCQECGSEVTEEHLPGPRPRYCQPCWPGVQRQRNADRQQRHRERLAQRRALGH